MKSFMTTFIKQPNAVIMMAFSMLGIMVFMFFVLSTTTLGESDVRAVATTASRVASTSIPVSVNGVQVEQTTVPSTTTKSSSVRPRKQATVVVPASANVVVETTQVPTTVLNSISTTPKKPRPPRPKPQKPVSPETTDPTTMTTITSSPTTSTPTPTTPTEPTTPEVAD